MVFGILPASQRESASKRESETRHGRTQVCRGGSISRQSLSLQPGDGCPALRPFNSSRDARVRHTGPYPTRSSRSPISGAVWCLSPGSDTASVSPRPWLQLVDIINRTKPPAHRHGGGPGSEFLHDHKRSIITQREVAEDTKSFSEALRRVLRQDPDVILVGELREPRNHLDGTHCCPRRTLVFGTFHTQDCPHTIDRMIDVFPTNQQEGKSE